MLENFRQFFAWCFLMAVIAFSIFKLVGDINPKQIIPGLFSLELGAWYYVGMLTISVIAAILMLWIFVNSINDAIKKVIKRIVRETLEDLSRFEKVPK